MIVRYAALAAEGVNEMLEWLCANWPSLLVGAAVLALVVLAVIRIVRDKKKGRSSCGCGCAGCPMSGSCHSANKGKK